MSNLLTVLHGSTGYAEFRLIDPEGRVERFFIPSPNLSDEAIDNIIERAGAFNVYFSVVPRLEIRGTRDACGAALAVWCDYDRPDSAPSWKLNPSAVVRTSPGKCQAYWFLRRSLNDLDLLEAINRSIAGVEGGDPRATDRARILRMPGSRNLKYPDKPIVILEHYDPDLRYSHDEVRRHYPLGGQPLRRDHSITHRPSPQWLNLVFDAIVDFLERDGLRPQLRGESVIALCPLHDDRNPSLSIHAKRGWYCHAGCGGGRLTRLAHLLGVRV